MKKFTLRLNVILKSPYLNVILTKNAPLPLTLRMLVPLLSLHFSQQNKFSFFLSKYMTFPSLFEMMQTRKWNVSWLCMYAMERFTVEWLFECRLIPWLERSLAGTMRGYTVPWLGHSVAKDGLIDYAWINYEEEINMKVVIMLSIRILFRCWIVVRGWNHRNYNP